MKPAGARFLVTLLIGRRLYWEVDREGIIEVPDVPVDAGPVLSFDVHDHRLVRARPITARRARQRFMREWGEQVHVVASLRDLPAMYGRDPRHGPALCPGRPLYSGLQLIDRLAVERGIDPAGRVLGLRLGSAEGHGRRLVLLFAYDSTGELLRFQEAANPPSLDYLVEDFRRSLPVGLASQDPHWFDQHSASAVLARLLPYPDEDSLWSLPLPVWWRGLERCAWGVTVLALLWSAAALWLTWQDAARQRVLDQSAREQAQQIQAELQRHTRALTRLGSVDMARAFEDAQQLWQPGVRIRVLASPGQTDYALRLAQDVAGAGTPGAVIPASLRAALDTLARQPPDGIRVLDPALSGDLHACYLRFRRQTTLPALLALAAAEP